MVLQRYVASIARANQHLDPRQQPASWKTIFCRHYRFAFNHCDQIGLQSYRIRWNNAIKGYYAVQSHSRSRCRYQ